MAVATRIPTGFSYSAAVEAGSFVFLGHHRGRGETFPEQLDGALAGIAATLAELGLGLPHVVKVNAWLRDVDDVTELERRFHDYFADGGFPARTTTTTEFVDADCLVMLDAVAYRG